MCELLGMECNVPTDIVFSFSGLRQRGGKTAPHADGWGLAFYEGRATRVFLEPEAACHSPLASFLSGHPIKTLLAIGHVRRRTRGPTTLANTHPFVRELWGRPWSFAHNGQLRGVKKLALGSFRPIGTTDSEHAFCWMLDQLRERWATAPSSGALQTAIEELAGELADLGVFNMLLADGRSMFAYRTTKLVYRTRRAPFGVATLVDDDFSVDFGPLTSPTDVVTTVASCPLTRDESWTEAPAHRLLVLRDGEVHSGVQRNAMRARAAIEASPLLHA